jgi:hypothetical protein
MPKTRALIFNRKDGGSVQDKELLAVREAIGKINYEHYWFNGFGEVSIQDGEIRIPYYTDATVILTGLEEKIVGKTADRDYEQRRSRGSFWAT